MIGTIKVDGHMDVPYNRHNINETRARIKMITSNNVKSLLSTVKGTTIANLETVTKVNTAAAHKSTSIEKHTTAQVMLFNGIKDYNIYAKAVIRSAEHISKEESTFEASETWFEHDQACYSIVNHKVNGKAYLYAVFNNSKSEYTINGMPATKTQVCAFMTPSAAKALLAPSGIVYNAKNDVHHNVIVRTIMLDSIVSIKACKQVITA